MQPLIDPRLRALKPIGKSEKVNRHRKVIGLVKRLRRTSILTTTAELGKMSDAVVVEAARVKEVKLTQAFREIQQKLHGALDRLKRQNPFRLSIPAKIETLIQASALKSTQGERK